MIPNAVLSDWLSGPGYLGLGGTPPYSSIVAARPGCVAHYEFSDQPGTNTQPPATDLSSTYDTGAIYDGPSNTFGGTFGSSGSNGYAATFTTNSALYGSDVSSVFAGSTGSWVVTFLPTALPTGTNKGVIVGLFYTGGPGNNDRDIYVLSDGSIHFLCNGATISSSAGAFSLNLWHEIIATWSSATSTLNLYLDQVLVATGAWIPAVVPNVSGIAVGGALGDTGAFGTLPGVAGTYDCVAFYNTALTSGDTAGQTTYGIFVNGLTSNFGTIRNLSASNAVTLNWSTTVGQNRSVTASNAITLDWLSAAGKIWNLSASNAVTLDWIAAGIDAKNWAISASNAVTLSSTAVPTFNHQYAVSATNRITITPGASEILHVPTIYNVSASSAMTMHHSTLVFVPVIHLVSASSGLYVYGLAVGQDNHIHVSAATGVSLSTLAAKPICYGPILLSASTNIKISGVPVLAANRNYLVSASTNLKVSGVGSQAKFGSVYVSASSGFSVSGIGRETKFGPVYLSASTGMVLSGSASKSKFGSVYLSAATGFSVSQVVGLASSGDKFVFATTNISVSTSSKFGKAAILSVSAATQLLVGSGATKTANYAVHASNSITVASLSRQCRDIHAAATTHVSVSSATPSGEGNLKAASTHNAMTFTVHASLKLTGTEAESRLTFTDLAQAVVLLPWRLTSLTRPDGGNIPHS